MRSRTAALVALAALAAPSAACDIPGRPPGWSEATHGDDAEADYDLLFSTDRVHEIRISIPSDAFRMMQEDLAALAGGGDDPREPPAEAIAACAALAPGAACSMVIDGNPLTGSCETVPGDFFVCVPEGGPPGGGGGDMEQLSADPIWIPVTVLHDDREWWFVGMRYKGNSSLTSSFRQGIGKLPFRLDFDKFEDERPEIDDQRFHGFGKMTFSSNWGDDSQIRECFVSEAFRDRGVPAARCAFYRVFVDSGAGFEYWGLYSMIEDPSDDPFLESQFGTDNGNVYKPQGAGADWTHFDAAAFAKKTNEDDADWSDVEAAIEALHSEPAATPEWREALESSFDVDRFLSWLAVNTVIVNWDSYGFGAHNYYLCADPNANGRLEWIPWDHNLAMDMARPDGSPALPETDAPTEIFHLAAGDDWPLISRLLADETYAAWYRGKVAAALEGLLAIGAGVARMRELHDLILPFVVGADGERPGWTTIASETAFRDSVDGEGGLAEHLRARHARVLEALDAE